MNTMTPAQAFANRTARLVAEAATPVYTTETKPREHMMAVEVEFDTGGRLWSHMADSEVDAYCADLDGEFRSLSDIDHSARCWCQA